MNVRDKGSNLDELKKCNNEEEKQYSTIQLIYSVKAFKILLFIIH